MTTSPRKASEPMRMRAYTPTRRSDVARMVRKATSSFHSTICPPATSMVRRVWPSTVTLQYTSSFAAFTMPLTRRLSVDRLLPRCMSASRILLPLTMRTCSSPPTMLPSRALPLLAMLAMLRWSLRWGGPEPAQLTAGLAARLLDRSRTAAMLVASRVGELSMLMRSRDRSSGAAGDASGIDVTMLGIACGRRLGSRGAASISPWSRTGRGAESAVARFAAAAALAARTRRCVPPPPPQPPPLSQT
mmetsp:Transcript_7470/g.22095  ORF Transcript_7470/g.22095 Transcript_7470/m.22095 type:complete len:246 (+) Transcript_7470:2116-2853(+)